jgi:hypothetical protein
LAERLGYQVEILAGSAATIDNFQTVLSDSAVGGIYFLGHGGFEARQGYLVFADGRVLSSDIERAAPLIDMVEQEADRFFVQLRTPRCPQMSSDVHKNRDCRSGCGLHLIS